ncbi:MAG: hypothetical protein HRU20_30375 [Pseudomonadales bacterium]|nr:hypothetical protein [Pseudomonadales bacterium]
MKPVFLMTMFLSIASAVTAEENVGEDVAAYIPLVGSDVLAEASCNPYILKMYSVDKETCVTATIKCLDKIVSNKIDIEADPMYSMNCLMDELNLDFEELLKKSAAAQ